MNSSIAIRINPAHLTILSHLSKIIYDDVTYIVLEYIMNSRSPLVEEQEMAMNLNLSNPTVRRSLIMLEKHGILLQTPHVRKLRVDDESTQVSSNMSNGNSVIGGAGAGKQNMMSNSAYIRQVGANRNMKTSDWKLNNTFYNGIKLRFEEMEKRLRENLKNRETLWFKCEQCNNTYSESEANLNNLVCLYCSNKPKLIEQGREDVTELRTRCNEVIAYMKKIFRDNQGSGADFEHIEVGERKGGVVGNKKYVEFGNLCEPETYAMFQEFRERPEKKKVFYEVMDYYVYEKCMKFKKG